MVNESEFNVMPLKDTPSGKGVRVLPVEFWPQTLLDWQDYQLNIETDPPLFARPGAPRVYITDSESIFVCREVSQFETRLGLDYSTSDGCIAIFFDTNGLNNSVPPRAAGSPREGLTSGGAREWMVNTNVPLNLAINYMEAFEITERNEVFGPVNPGGDL